MVEVYVPAIEGGDHYSLLTELLRLQVVSESAILRVAVYT